MLLMALRDKRMRLGTVQRSSRVIVMSAASAAIYVYLSKNETKQKKTKQIKKTKKTMG